MVRLGFIAEGATEKIVLQHSDLFDYLRSLSLNFIEDVIDANGNGNLLPHNINKLTKILEEKGATYIFLLTDLDKDECITNTKERITPQPNHFITVAVKAIEAWFLADSEAMGKYLEDTTFTFDEPEAVTNPFEEIRAIRKTKTGKGFTDKKVLANSIVRKHGFSIQRAAQHHNCNSARYFLRIIKQLSEEQKA